MLESAGFDFRNRHPQKILVKLARELGLDRDRLGRMAYNICLDVYRTFAPLKQTAVTLAIASLELAARLNQISLEGVVGNEGIDYKKWSTTRSEVMGKLGRAPLTSPVLTNYFNTEQKHCWIF